MNLSNGISIIVTVFNKDKYIESQINEKHISLWRDSKTNINPALEIMKKNGVLPVDQILKYYKS